VAYLWCGFRIQIDDGLKSLQVVNWVIHRSSNGMSHVSKIFPKFAQTALYIYALCSCGDWATIIVIKISSSPFYILCLVLEHKRRVITCWISHQIERRFHNKELHCQLLHLVLDTSPLLSSSLGSSQTLFSLAFKSMCLSTTKSSSRRHFWIAPSMINMLVMGWTILKVS